MARLHEQTFLAHPGEVAARNTDVGQVLCPDFALLKSEQSPYRYVPASSAQQQPGQSEAARIAPDIVAQNPDVVVVHGSTFTGSANLRLVLGELIRSVDQAKGDIRGFVVYSSAPLNAAALSIDGPLRSKLQFMYAPIVNRFRPPDPSAKVLRDHVQHLCGI
ncbi:hypothetical protein GCM10010869_28870 [Mesorhizobium tianshanense]|uniref:Uncharacterized protein n=1 Tax=Mesorhizobium tianshanense TaxID=39844 RepID=A0A562NG91_9HYPH|nr:hypothetical protein [Mesorhizobium tianshanense]TWI31103.1 hypothetical protein IQ26_04606 [Mesorhizobium tianshanense]GLS37294.1 hypothetical protein GCM10010869_28870 [Mesorhizobium tianshanense]